MSSDATPPAVADSFKARVPNYLVAARLGLAGVFVALLSSAAPLARSQSGDAGIFASPIDMTLMAAAVVFVIAALTDWLDGYLARRFGAITRLGRIMDPFADKVLVLGGFICLAGANFKLPWQGDQFQASGILPWMVVVIVARELLVTSLRGLSEGEGADFSAVWAGKVKMIAQSVGLPLIIVALAVTQYHPRSPMRLMIDITVWIVLVLTVVSAWPYLAKASSTAGRRVEAAP